MEGGIRWDGTHRITKKTMTRACLGKQIAIFDLPKETFPVVCVRARWKEDQVRFIFIGVEETTNKTARVVVVAVTVVVTVAVIVVYPCVAAAAEMIAEKIGDKMKQLVDYNSTFLLIELYIL